MGWVDAVKKPDTAVESTMKRVDTSTTTRDHQVSMMREVAKLVIPANQASSKIGFIDEARFKTTADIALKFNVIGKPAENAYTNDLMKAAVEMNNPTR